MGNNKVIGPKFLTGILIAVMLNFYILHCVITSMLFAGNENLFPRSYTKSSDILIIFLTPSHHTYSIWGLNCFIQLAWMLFVIVSLCNEGSACNILGKKFYGSYIFGIISISVWLFVWAYVVPALSLIMLIFNQTFLDYAFALSCINLRSYLKTHQVTDDNKTDIWCHRIFVQNGILFYAAWNFMLCLQNMGIVLHYDLGASDQTSCIITLVIFMVSLFAFFVAENFYYFETYTEYTLSFYFVIIWSLGGIFTEVWGKNDVIGGLVLGMLLLTCTMWVIRCYLVWIRHKVVNSYGGMLESEEEVSLVSKK